MIPALPDSGYNGTGTADDQTNDEVQAETTPLGEEYQTPTPARRGSYFASQDFGLNSETFFPDPDSDFAALAFTANAGTMSFCLQPQWNDRDTNTQSIISTPDNAANRVQIARTGDALQFTLAGPNGVASTAAAPVASWHPGERHLVTATWGGGKTQIYVDGRLADQQTYQGQFGGQLVLDPNNPLTVGAPGTDNISGAGGSLSQLQIRDRQLGEADISAMATDCQSQ
jgi:hypothetical protein